MIEFLTHFGCVVVGVWLGVGVMCLINANHYDEN